MGIGDQLIGSSFAKGARARGVRVALGDGIHLRWDHNSEQVFRHNPNLVFPGEPLHGNIEWMHYYKGKRLYNRQEGNHWVWNYNFRVQPGEFFFTDGERQAVDRLGQPKGFVVIEPNLKSHLTTKAPFLINKQWPYRRYAEVATRLRAEGHRIVQFVFSDSFRIPGATLIQTPSFRSAAAILERAALYIGVEGGMHHAAAAVGVPAVVLFGGWLPPAVLGYDTHINLTGGEERFCGLLLPCAHCAAAMQRISVDDVVNAALSLLRKETPT